MKQIYSDIQIGAKLLQDGHIHLGFVDTDGKTICEFALSPHQAVGISSILMTTAAGSSRLALSSSPETIPVDKLAFIEGSKWALAQAPNRTGVRIMLAQVGDLRIGFSILDVDLHAFGRAMIETAADANSEVPLKILARSVFKDFCKDASALGKRFYLERKQRALESLSYFSAYCAGRTFKPIRNLSLGKGIKTPKYPPVGRCIYCDASVYSDDPLIRDFPFGAEHIVAEGLGGTLELPAASCRPCETATGAIVEQDVIGRTMKALRVHLGLKKAGSGPHPKTLPLDVEVLGKKQVFQIPVEHYPIILNMIGLAPVDLDTASARGPITVSMSMVRISHDERLLFQRYGISSFATAFWDTHKLSRMLAKIGHSFAAAEIGLSGFRPLTTDLIRTGNVDQMKYVGGDVGSLTPHTKTELHQIELGYQRIKGKVYVVARIRLFSNHSAPTYSVIVGESLELLRARLRRRFSSRSSRTPAR